MADRRSSYSLSDGSTLPGSFSLEGSGSNWATASGHGIALTIQNLQSEQDRVQKKTFTNWMNTYLCKRNPPMKVDDLFEEVKDGIVLLSLLEVLSGERLPMEKGAKLTKHHHLSNISTALKFLERKKIKLVNINASSIADGKPAIVLGLIWTIILYFQIEETIVNTASNDNEDSKKKTVLVKENLLKWAETIAKKYGLHVKNFQGSWTDGVMFNALIHTIKPDLVDMDQIRQQQARVNLEHAFSTAESHLGIPRLLDPEDVDVEKPDEKSIMTYVAQFVKKFPDAGGASGVPGTDIRTPEKEMEAYNALMNWLNGEAKGVLVMTLEPVTDRESEFLDYLGFKTELDRRQPSYLKIGEKVLSGRALRITLPDWEKLDVRWQEVDEQVLQWLQKLDTCLPGKLGKLGQWLYEAEKLLCKKEETVDSVDEMTGIYAGLAQEHKDFFKDLEEWKQFFSQIRRAGRYEGMMIHGPQFDHMSKRLDSVAVHSSVRQNRLDYTHMRYKFLSCLALAEAKLKQWSAKSGRQDMTEDVLADYVNCIDRRHMIENTDKNYTEIKNAAEKYKIGGAGKSEVIHIDQFLDEVSGKWRRVSAEIKSIRSMLEEVILAWKRYSACVDVLNAWLKKGDLVMRQNLEAKEEFFKDLGHYEEKHKILNESASFLLDVLSEPFAAEVKQMLALLNKHFRELVEDFHSFHQNEVIEKARQEYEKGVFSLEGWLNDSTTVLDQKIRCTHAELKDHLSQLDKCSIQIQEAENKFKVTTKTAQSLVKDSSQEAVTSMLKTLNMQKEVIVRLKKEIPERMKYIKAMLPNVESLETGILDLQKWLTEGEMLLQDHKLEGTPDGAYARLERHKAFYTEITHQKSILESKNKVFQTISSTRNKLKNVDFTPVENLMSTANERFQTVVTSAKDWDKKLETLARLWRSLEQKQHQLDEWLDTAHNILDDSEDDPDSLMRKHKKFFDQMDRRMISDYEICVSEVLQHLNASERKHLLQILDHMKERWDHVLRHAPIRLLKLEFVIPENKFEKSMEEAEVVLQQQRDQIKYNQNVKEALVKHRQIFVEGNLVPSCEERLDEMKNLAQHLLRLSRDEQSLDQRYRNHLDRWKKLKMIADDIHLQLKQLPERWNEYNQKMSSFDGWVQNVEKLLKGLSQEGITSDEFKDMLAKFQKEMRNMNASEEDAKWLVQYLEDLIKDASDTDARREREHLNGILNRFHELKPKMDSAMDKSTILSKGYDFKDTVSRKANWLDEAQKLSLDHPHIDSLDDARAYLHEHETLLNRLETEKSSIQAEIEAGRHLQKDKNAPAFIHQYLAELDKKWKDTNELAKAKLEKLKKQVRDWEDYEGEKTKLLNYLKKAENELEKPSEMFSQENAQKEFQSKKELQNTLNKLRDSLSEVTNLNAHLAKGASHGRQAPLKSEMTEISKRLDKISHRLNTKLTDLEATILKWSEYYKRLNNFCDWLNEKEERLNEVYENKQDSPEVQLQKAEGITSQVFENHVTLENLEKDARGLTQNFRSRETAALKSKLTSVRRQWGSLCDRAKDRSTALSGNVAHWQKYQTLHDHLLPWVLKAEKYCATDLPKCASCEEAKDLYDLHQAFLQECEENLPVFDQLSAEASYLMDQPNMHRDLEAFQKRWGSILNNSEDRSQKIDKVFEVWSAFGSELEKFQESLEKIHSRLSDEPNVTTSDVQVLEHELALAKALQEEVRSHQPQLNTLTRQLEQVQVHASPEGLKMLKSQQDSIRNSWNDINKTVAERLKVLANALQHRKDFYNRLQDSEKWMKSMQRKLDSGSEIYSDEIADTKAKLKVLEMECKSQEPMLQGLQQEFKELISMCNDDEAAVLTEQFDKMMQDYTQMEDCLGGRKELCDKWSSYADAQRDIQGKIKVSQARLSSPAIQQNEVTQIIHEIEGLHKSMQPWNREADALDTLMSTTQMVIKDRATQRTLHFGSELQALLNKCDMAVNLAKQKDSQLEELTQLSTEFIQKKDDLVHSLTDVQEKVMSLKPDESSLVGLRNLLRQTQDIRDSLHSHNSEYEQLRELGRRIMITDPAKAAVIQQQLGQMNSDWETVQTLVAEKQQLYSGIANTWQQYEDGKQVVMKIVADLDPQIQQELAFTNQADVKKSLDQHRNAEFALHASQTNLDHMNSKGVQLLEDLKSIAGFDRSGVESDLDSVNLKWETSNAAIEEHRENLEAQLACWDQIESGLEEVGSWLGAVVGKMEDSLKNFDDVNSVESRLTKFRDEAPYFEELMAEVNEKVKDLKELNKGQSVPSLTSAQKDVQLHFKKAVSLASQLETMKSEFSDEQQSLQKAISNETEWMNQFKQALSKCDDITGSSDDLIRRYRTCKDLQQELAEHQLQTSSALNKAISLQKKYPSSETSNLSRDGADVIKKLESLTVRANRIEDAHLTQLEQHCTEAQQQVQRWLNSVKEKVAWCGDTAGDRYSVEAKLATVKDLESSLQEGELKRKEAIRQLDISKQVFSKSRKEEFEDAQKTLESEWQSLVKSVKQMRTKLESSMEQWQLYDQHYGNLSEWLKNTEAKMRSEAALQQDLPGKKNQLAAFKDLFESLQSQRADFEKMRDAALQIGHITGDDRTVSYADHLINRYQTLTSAVQEQTKRCEQNIDEHNLYVSRHKAAQEWVNKARQDLEQCSVLIGDEDSLNTKLAIVKDLLVHKEEGSTLVNTAFEAGEKLYPNTSNEGRESIRHEMRSLRDTWDRFSDHLSNTQRQLDSSRMQLMSFDENFEQLNKWVDDMEVKMRESEMKTTLPEKKNLLQQYKTHHQDILSHQKMIDSINDKGTVLTSSQVQNKLKHLNNKYSHLCNAMGNLVKKTEEYVEEHQQYQDLQQQCHDWVNATSDKISVCAEVGGNRQALQNRMDRLQDIKGTLQEGEAKIKSASQQGEKVMLHTSSQGQINLRHELASLGQEWDVLVAKVNDTQQGLLQAIRAMEVYDDSCESLVQWLRETESKLRDCELKSSLQEKQKQVEVFKSLEQQIHQKQSHITDLQNRAAQIHSSGTRITNQSAHLATKYEAVKNLARDTITKWEDYVEEHHAFLENYSHCIEWIKTLRNRLKVCGNVVENKQDVEDHLLKLQELSAERDEGASHIHQTIESGERLFPDTTSEGRDVIRQDIRNMRDQWEVLCDEISEIQRKLDLNISQWTSYDENSKVFQKWLLDMEAKLKEGIQLHATLPEKKAQLQNHKVLHEDILSREHIINNLKETAHSLTQSIPSAKVNKLVSEQKQKYASVCETSRRILDKHELAVHDHQLYQDAAQDFTDWLNSARERLEACTDRSGDKLSLQGRKDRLKECSSSVTKGDHKLSITKELEAKTAKNTSHQGRQVLEREVNHFQREWEDFLNLMQHTETSLEQTIGMWDDFESKFEQFAEWLQDMELKVKGNDLKNTLKEKQARVDEFKKKREEILARQPEMDKFTDDAQNLMHSSSDVRLGSQVSQLTNKYQSLLSLVKDLITKWEGYVQVHQLYDSRMENFKEWLTMAEQRLTQCSKPVRGDESLEEKKAIIQLLLSEKVHGHQKLSSVLESGEKLYVDTAATGREKIREELRVAKQNWENLLSNLSETQRGIDRYMHQFSLYSDGRDHLLKWLAETGAALRTNVDLRNTLQEKRHQLQAHLSLLQDISSHRRLVESVIEKAQCVLQNTDDPEVTGFITTVSSHYEKLSADAKNLIQRSEQHVAVHQRYQDSLQTAIDWMAVMKDKLALCADTVGDRHTIQNKLDRLQELICCMPEGARKLEDCENHAQATMDATGLKGRQNIQSQVNVLRTDWEDYKTKLNSLKDGLEQALHFWSMYESKHQEMLNWLKSTEKKIKECPLKSSLEEKKEQLVKCQELMHEIKAQQREIDKFSDAAQNLQHLTSESQVGSAVSQLMSRYQTLQVSGKDLINRCEQNVEDHKCYKMRFADTVQWLEKAKKMLSECSEAGGSRVELESRLEKLQRLMHERDTGYAKLNQCVEIGEKLYPSTASDGREVIRQELRKLKLDYESVFDDLSTIQRQLEVSLVQWTSFDESFGQVEHWLTQMESKFESQIPLQATLEEKKSQLLNCKALQQDVLSYQRVIESITDKVSNLVQSNRDSELSKFISQARSWHNNLCATAKEHVSLHESFVGEHQQYSDLYISCNDWLNIVQEKLTACSDVSGDRNAIQNRLDRIQDILTMNTEGEQKVREVIELSGKVLSHTSPQGKAIIVRDTETLKAKKEEFILAFTKTKSDLQACMNKWKDFQVLYDQCASWLKDLENRVRDTEMRATLAEKQQHWDKFKALQSEVIAHQNDLESLHDVAHDLAQVSTESGVVSQASQLTARYQTASITLKELFHRWEQFVFDHQTYMQAYEQCQAWLEQMMERVGHVGNATGNKSAVQDMLNQVQKLIHEKEEGMHMLQIALDKLQIVLPNTSVAGRDKIHRDMQTLQQEYDSLSAELNDRKGHLDGILAQWMVYDDSVEQLQRWLKDLEDQLTAESALQNTLQEKKLQLERVKVIQLNASSQQSTIDSLNEKAQSLKKTSKDEKLSGQISQVVDRYERLVKGIRDLNEQCEKYLRDHQIYRDTYLDMSGWLGATVDRLSMCSDVHGDRHAIEAHLHKVEEIVMTVEVGRKKLLETKQKADIVMQETSGHGQNLIQEELRMLISDFEDFESDLSNLKSTFVTLKDRWTKYDEFYEELSRWMKDTENSMKADADLKASLEQKIDQLSRHRSVHEETVQQQKAFEQLGEQAQFLMQSSAEGRVSTQLTGLSTRYSALITLSKDLLKRYDQTVQDHEHYSNAYSRSRAWLLDAVERLTDYADTSGDQYKIQAQLEKLQEFAVMKEEAQIYLHMAQTWGEKTMENTSVEGREVIRTELQQLQTEWDLMISQATDTKVNLEACLLHWSDYTSSHEKVLKWFKEMEKRLRETQPKPDLSEKKAELQHVKGLYKDIVSYEQMVESVIKKSTDLAEKNPACKATVDTSQIQTRYNSVKEQAKDLLARCEQNVAYHQDFHDSCNSFSSWLRTAIEKLTTCSGTFGEKSTIEDKIERAKSLLANMSEGTQRLSQATKAGDATLPSTSASGQTKIRHELQAINKDFEEFHKQLLQTLSDLETCLIQWNEFEESYQNFGSWLRETEVLLQTELKQKATAAEKKQHWEKYQLYKEDAISHQSSLDRVREKAQALLQTNADAKISHAVTQLTTRYNGIIALSKDISSNLEVYYNNHKLYDEKQSAYADWLREMKQRLKTVSSDRDSKKVVMDKIVGVEEIQSALDQGHTILSMVLESCEKTLPNTNQKGALVIRREADEAKSAYEDILTQVSQLKRSLESALNHWEDFEYLYQQVSDWISDVEQKIEASPDFKADLPEKKSDLERYKVLQADILAHKGQLDKLEEKAANLKDSGARSKTAELKSKYDNIIKSSKDVLSHVEEQVGSHEKYRKGYIECLDWLTNAKYQLQHLSDYSGDKKSLQERLAQLRDFKASLVQGAEMLTSVAALEEKLCHTTSKRGQEIVQKEMDDLHEGWKLLNTAVGDVECKLEVGIAKWTELDSEQLEFSDWMERMDKKLKECQENKPDHARKRAQLQMSEIVCEEILGHKSELNKIKEKGDEIAQRTNDMRVSSNVMQLSTQYQTLCSSAKNTVSKLKEFVNDHNLYDDALDSAATWLKTMEKRVRNCNNNSGNWHAIQKRIEDVKAVTASLDDGLQKVNYVCDQAEKILPHTSLEGKKMIEEQVIELTNDWERLNADIAECTAMLENIQQSWHEYDHYYNSVDKWLADTESVIKSNPESFTKLSECKTQLDRYKMIVADAENHSKFMNELTDRAANLEALCNGPGIADSLAEIENRYAVVVDKAKDIVKRLQKDYDEHQSFFEAQQNCEKWLLAMSHKLISYNKLNTSTLELTNGHIEKLRLIQRELDNYRATLDSVSQLGHQLILSNPDQPSLADQVQKQQATLEESYCNLQSMAEQIRNQLTEIRNRWLEYKQLLDSTHDYLTNDFPEWLAEAEKNVPNTQNESQKQREITQEKLDKLYSMKQELQNAFRQFENMGHTDQLENREEGVECSLSQFTEQVNSELNTCINQAEKRLERLRDVIRKWDSVERMRQELRHWLHNKQEELSSLENEHTRLHPEAVDSHLEQLRTFQDEVRARGPALEELQSHYRFLTQHNPSSVDPVIRAIQDDWEELLGQIEIVIHDCEISRAKAREFQAHRDSMDEYLETYARQLDVIDKTDNPVLNKSLGMQKLCQEVEHAKVSISELKVKACDLKTKLSQYDQGLIEVMISDTEHKLDNIETSVQCKLEEYNLLNMDITHIKTEAECCITWLNQCQESIGDKPTAWNNAVEVNLKLEGLKKLRTELNSRKTHLDPVIKKAQELMTAKDFFSQERKSIEKLLTLIQTRHNEASFAVDNQICALEEVTAEWKDFVAKCEQQNIWLKEMQTATNTSGFDRPLASDVDRQLDKCKILTARVQSQEQRVNEIREKAKILMQYCTDEGKEEMHKTVSELTSQHEDLLQRLKQQQNCLMESAHSRKKFESSCLRIERWCKETEMKCKRMFPTDCAVEILEEQLQIYKKLGSSAQDFQSLAVEIKEQGESYLSSLHKSDQTVLLEKLETIQSTFSKVCKHVQDCIQVTEDTIKTRICMQEKVTHFEHWIKALQAEIMRSSVSCSQELKDAVFVKTVLESFEKELTDNGHTCKEMNALVEKLKTDGQYTQADDITRVTDLYHLLRDQVQSQMEICNTAITTQNAFIQHINEQEAFLRECEDMVSFEATSSIPVFDCIAKYEAAMVKLQQLEPNLFVAMERAHQIGKQSTGIDCNEITGRVGELISQFQNLKTCLQDSLRQLETSKNWKGSFEAAVLDTVTWFEEEKHTLGTCENLHFDTDKLTAVIEKHQLTTAEAGEKLQSLKDKAEMMRKDFEDSNMSLPSEICEKLQTIKSLEDFILVDVAMKERYLSKALSERKQFEDSLRRISEWLRGAEHKINSMHDGLDYDTLETTCGEFEDYFTEPSVCQNEIEQITELSQRILPTLDVSDSTTVTHILKSVDQRYSNVMTTSKKKQAVLEQKVGQWKSFQNNAAVLHGKMDAFEAEWTVIDKSVDTSPKAVKAHLDLVKIFIERIETSRSEVDDLNDVARDLERGGSTNSRTFISHLISTVNHRWDLLINHAQTKASSLEEIEVQWTDLMFVAASLQTSIEATETIMSIIPPSALTYAELCNRLCSLKEISSSLQQIEPQIASLQSSSFTFQNSLPTAEARISVSENCLELINRYERLKERAKKETAGIENEVDVRESFHSEAEQSISWMRKTIASVEDFRPQTVAGTDIMSKFSLYEQEISIWMEQANKLESSSRTKYSAEEAKLPLEMQEKLSELHLLRCEILTTMKKKKEELLRIHEDREEYRVALQSVTSWLQGTDMLIQEKIISISESMVAHQDLLLKFDDFKTMLHRLRSKGGDIIQHSYNCEEKLMVQKTLAGVNRQWLSLQAQATTRTQELSEAEDLLHAINEVGKSVQEWLKQTEAAIDVELVLTDGDKIRDQLKVHRNVHKNIDTNQDKVIALHAMVKQLEQVCPSPDNIIQVEELKQRMAAIQTKAEMQLSSLETANKKIEDIEREIGELTRWLGQTRTCMSKRNTTIDLHKQLAIQEVSFGFSWPDLKRESKYNDLLLQHLQF